MSNLTEKAIREAFVRLINEHPLEKITVREIAQECGISRNTFYYHYHDIYDLLAHLFREEEQRLVVNAGNVQTLRETFEESLKFVLENRRGVYHVYNSVSRDVLTEYMYNACEVCMRSYVEGQCGDLRPSQKDFDDLVFLYAGMLEGAVINIMREGLTRDVESLIDNAIRMLEGTIRLALENSCTR